MNAYRVNIINFLKLASDFEAQREYQNDVPYVGVPYEMCCQWYDDFYHPDTKELKEAFSLQELDKLREFNEVFDKYEKEIPELLEDLLEFEGWREISNKAKSIVAELGWDKIEAKYDEYE
jgi:hypothetical protein